VTTADSSGSRSQVTQTVTNIRTAVDACRSAYVAQQNWVTKDNAYTAYQAKVTAAKHKHPTGGTAKLGPAPPSPGPRPLAAGQRPPSPGGVCPASTAFGIPASALTPAAAGSS
jgi:hypothetical protein